MAGWVGRGRRGGHGAAVTTLIDLDLFIPIVLVVLLVVEVAMVL